MAMLYILSNLRAQTDGKAVKMSIFNLISRDKYNMSKIIVSFVT